MKKELRIYLTRDEIVRAIRQFIVDSADTAIFDTYDTVNVTFMNEDGQVSGAEVVASDEPKE